MLPPTALRISHRVSALAALLAALAGCAAQTMTSPEHNYALRLDGSTVVATRGVGGHRAATLINGVADPEAWRKGEGWEAPFTRKGQMDARPDGRSRSRMASGYAQVKIRLAEARRVNRVVVRALDTHGHPFKGIESGELLVRSPGDTTDVWRTMATIEKGKVLVRRQIKGEVAPRTIFRFHTEEIEGIRLSVYETGDAMRLVSGGAVSRAISDTVRLLEIEVSGPVALGIIDAPNPAATASGARHAATEQLRGCGGCGGGDEEQGGGGGGWGGGGAL